MVRRWAESYFTGMFFVPDKEFVPPDPNLVAEFESVYFPSFKNTPLHGIFLKTRQKSVLGTVVHCHGNAGRVYDHAPLVQSIIDIGCHVLVFDYGGYGQSEGQPTPLSIVDDALAALAYCKTRSDVDRKKIALFGQSLGSAAAAGAMAGDTDVRCLILEGTFTTYRSMARHTTLGKILYPITPFVIPDIGPIKDLAKIGNRPTLLIHGEKDDVVPAKFSRQMHRKFSHHTTLKVFKDLGHLEGESLEPEYKVEIKKFLTKHFSAV